MKAFFYTLVLTAVLIAAIIFLQSLPQPRRTPRVQPQTPMRVRSEPARLPTVEGDVTRANRDALFETGVELLDLWHIPEAIDVFETVVGMDSSHVGALLKLVECYSHPMIALEGEAKRRLDDAVQACRRTGADTLWVSVLRNLYVAGAPDAAAETLEKLDGHKNANDDVLFLLGAACLERGELGQAERYLGDLLDRDPSLGRAKELLVRLKAVKSEYADAEGLARDLAATYPEESYPYVLLSQVLLLGGEMAEAVEFANNALVLDPRYIPAIVSRASIHAAQGEVEAARVGFEKLLLFDKPMLSAIAMDGIAYAEFLSGRFEQGARDMDEAIRLAMSAGSATRGLVYASRLIDYLCQLGRPEIAEAVFDRWMARSGDIPSHLGQLRILIAKGDSQSVQAGLERIRNAPQWRRWMRRLEIDYADVYALSLIHERDFAGAISLLDAVASSGDPYGRRAYLKGFALFEFGEAERTTDLMEKARIRMHRLEFPYYGEPVLYVQSVFFSAEAALARGDGGEAERRYTEFLELWGDSDWGLQAVARAREKLMSLSAAPPSG